MVTTLKRAIGGLLRGSSGAPLSVVAGMWRDRQPNTLRILMYHRIDDDATTEHLAPGTLSATPAAFAQQMEVLSRHFCPVRIEQVQAALRGEQDLPPRSVLVTFDDAYRSFAEHAWPVLQRHSIPVVLFVPTGYPGSPERVFWWDALYWSVIRRPGCSTIRTPLGNQPVATRPQRAQTFRRLASHIREQPFSAGLETIAELLQEVGEPVPAGQVLTWNALRRLQQEGVAIAPHTQTHPMLDRIPLAVVRQEIQGACRDLQREVGAFSPVLAYPGGHTNAAIADIARDMGLEMAVTTRRGANVLGKTDPFHFHRINVGARSTAQMIQTQLSLPPSLLNSAASITG